MKKLLRAALSIAFMGGLSLGVSLAGQFEGEVDYNVTMSDGNQAPMNYFLKGKKIRIEMNMKGHQVVDIMDLSAKKVYMLMPEQKMVMTSTIPNASSVKAKAEGKLTKTGNTKTILGRTATEWTYDSKAGTTSIWASSGMGFFMMAKGPGAAGSDSTWAQAVKNGGLFPLEVDAKTSKGSMTMTATKIDEKSLDDSLFTVPSDYKDMSSMMQGLGASIPAGAMPSGMPHF
jgi:hypothetical protein